MTEWEGPELLFVYGTLKRRVGGELHRLLRGRAVFVATATFAGRLFLVDGYPGVLADAAGEVSGELYRLRDPAATLPVLDDYEECGPQFGDAAEYRRSVVAVTQADGSSCAAWIYLYNRPVAGLELIAGGEFPCSEGD